jgi:hypothetical protein
MFFVPYEHSFWEGDLGIVGAYFQFVEMQSLGISTAI